MKSLILTLLLSAMTASHADTEVRSKEVVLTLSAIYVPLNQSSDAFVVLSGLFPNSCYKWGNAEVTHPTPLVHEIRAYGTITQSICLMSTQETPLVVRPYQEKVELGRLQAGTHTVRVFNGDGTSFEQSFTVSDGLRM